MVARHAYAVVTNVLIATIFGLGSMAASATQVQMAGELSYTYSNVEHTAVMTVQRIVNSDVASSGPLRLELWALAAPFDGTAALGYKMAEYPLAPLAAGHSYTDVFSGAVPFAAPPKGAWSVVLLLTENTGGPVDDGFLAVDYLNFRNLIYFGVPTSIEIVVEYYYPPWDAYFITSLQSEIDALDSGQFPGWVRTGHVFHAYDPAKSPPASSVAVCRFFNVSFQPKSSHFYALHGLGCEQTIASFPDWTLESSDLFNMQVPDANGGCAADTVPVYRLYNNGKGGAPNHRFTTDLNIRDQMIAGGWTPEGYGVGVEFCAPI
jgi:hypothetical protein